jgi:hypothetical protein
MDKQHVFAVHPSRAREMGIIKKKIAFISFGSRKHYVTVKLDEGVEYDNACVSKKLADELHIPDYPVYETCVKNNEIVIGPYIGILVSEEDKNITERRLYIMKDYVRDYSRLHGAVVVFALDKTDTANHLIEGYCYHPSMKSWQRGIFPSLHQYTVLLVSVQNGKIIFSRLLAINCSTTAISTSWKCTGGFQMMNK